MHKVRSDSLVYTSKSLILSYAYLKSNTTPKNEDLKKRRKMFSSVKINVLVFKMNQEVMQKLYNWSQTQLIYFNMTNITTCYTRISEDL